jgi:glycosyltransferase involved in cell wall biosynthesis
VILAALAAANCVLVNDPPPNVETVGDAGLYFSGDGGVEALSEQLGRLLDEPETVEEYRSRAAERARRYSWEAVTDEYERMLTAVCSARRPGRLPPELVDSPPASVPTPTGEQAA